nr:hypothetical protein [Tanacetum cinerariifolium]
MVQKASGSHRLLEMSRSDKGLEIIQEEDTQHYENTSKEHNEVAPIKYELGDLDEPPNYIAALADPKSDKWLEVMYTEIQSMKDNQVWYLVDLPSNGRTTYGVDYGETFSPVTDVRAIRILLAIGEAAYILGIKIICDRSKQLIALCQGAYLEKILKNFRMENSKKGYTPMMEKTDYKKSQDAKTPTEDDTKSQTRYVFVLNGEAVDWKSAKQSTTAMSSTEDEYIATAEASIEVV